MKKLSPAIFFLDVVSLFAVVDGQAMRLVDGPTPWEGRVEVSYDGQWNTVCDDHFGVEEARVVCRHLGYNDIDQAGTAFYGAGIGNILLDDLYCLGFEDSLVTCKHSRIGNHDCDHSEDAGVYCGHGGNGCLPVTPCPEIAEECTLGETEVVRVADEVCPICRCAILVNAALNKPASQSTLHINGGHPEKAVDGNRGISFEQCTRTRSTDENPNRWWRVDLEDNFKVQAVVITNRGDGNQTANFEITVSSHDFDPSDSVTDNTMRCLYHPGAIADSTTVHLNCFQPIVGRYVTFIMYSTTNFLSFCEMEVLISVCPAEPACPQNCIGGITEFYETSYCRMCRCVPQDFSEETVETPDDPMCMNLLIATSTLLFVMLILLMVLAVWFCRHKHRKRKRRTKKVAPVHTVHNNFFPGLM